MLQRHTKRCGAPRGARYAMRYSVCYNAIIPPQFLVAEAENAAVYEMQRGITLVFRVLCFVLCKGKFFLLYYTGKISFFQLVR